MKARDAPVISEVPAPVNQLISAPKPKSVASHKKTAAPVGKARKKPPKTDGYFWRPHGVGYDLKKHVFVASHNGEKIRREIYVAHLGREEFAAMKKRHKGMALERAITQWIAARDH